MRKAPAPFFGLGNEFPRRSSAWLRKHCCLTIAAGLVVAGLLIKSISNWSQKSRFSLYDTRECEHRDWWDCPRKLPPGQTIFNKSILYLKPHKTGSESFKEILIRIGKHYNLTTDKELDWKLPQLTSTSERRLLLQNQYDILLRHSRYRKNVTEKRIRGWVEGQPMHCGYNCTAGRELLRIVTIRDPIDRLISHYFSQRRFRTFTPKRGFVRPGRLSEEEEISDFEQWLLQYTSSQQVMYSRDKTLWSGPSIAGQELLDGAREVVDFYDHVIVTEQWRESLCLFGFTERIHPSLLLLRKRNSNGKNARRFKVSSVLRNRTLYAKILSKIEYDFVLHAGLLKKYHEKLEAVESPEFRRYCAHIGSRLTNESAKMNR